MAVRPVILVTEEAATVAAVAAALSSNGKLQQSDVLRTLQQLISRLEGGAVAAVLMDIDALPDRSLGSLEPVVRRFPETRFVLLGGEILPSVLIEALQIGARHYLLKKAIPDELTPALHRICSANGSGHHGAIVTVLSAGGGCGATTLAINVAQELQDLGSGHALLADLDCAYGPMASYLNLQGQFGALDLLERTGPLDADLIRSTALAFSPELHVLSNSATNHLPSVALNATPRLEEFLRACKTAYPYSVLDAPRISHAALARIAHHSDAFLVVMQLTIKDLRVGKFLMQELLDMGVANDKLVPVISRFRKRVMMIEPDQARRALGREHLTFLSNDFSAVLRAINFGQPLAKAAPHCPLAREIHDLARVLLDKQLAPAVLQAQGR